MFLIKGKNVAYKHKMSIDYENLPVIVVVVDLNLMKFGV